MIPAPPHDIVRAVRAELAVPGRYQLDVAVRPERRSILEQIFSWLADRLRDFEHALAARVHVSSGQRSIIGDVVIVAAVLLVAYVGARLLAQAQIDRAQRGAGAELGRSRSAHALNALAAQAAAAGEYARAVRLVFAAAVTLLDLRGIVRDDESATINELRRALRERDDAAEAPFMEIARIYTRAAYAERPTDAAAWERAQHAYGELVRSAAG